MKKGGQSLSQLVCKYFSNATLRGKINDYYILNNHSQYIHIYICLREKTNFRKSNLLLFSWKNSKEELAGFQHFRILFVTHTWLCVFRKDCNFRSNIRINFSTIVTVLKYLSHQDPLGWSGSLKMMLNFFVSVKLWKTSFKFTGSNVMSMADTLRT